MIEKYKSRRIRVAIRHVLMDKWDPIGVAGVIEAVDEYDAYIGGVFELLQEQVTREDMESYLRDIETVGMGLMDANGQALMAMSVRLAAVDELRGYFTSRC